MKRLKGAAWKFEAQIAGTAAWSRMQWLSSRVRRCAALERVWCQAPPPRDVSAVLRHGVVLGCCALVLQTSISVDLLQSCARSPASHLTPPPALPAVVMLLMLTCAAAWETAASSSTAPSMPRWARMALRATRMRAMAPAVGGCLCSFVQMASE